MSLRIYVEGGGEGGRTASACRAGFREFFSKIVPAGRRPRIIACGDRGSAVQDFFHALRQYRGVSILVLVDSEGAIASGVGPWEHLDAQAGIARPPEAADDQLQFMVQCMEAWFLADRQALSGYYGQGFNASALPDNPDIEAIAKADVLHGLEAATRHTVTKGRYHKTRHGFELLAEMDPERVCQASRYAARLKAAIERVSQ